MPDSSTLKKRLEVAMLEWVEKAVTACWENDELADLLKGLNL